MHGLVEDRLALHDVLLDGVGEELALEFRIVHQECVAQRHDVCIVGAFAEGHAEILLLFLRPRALHEAEGMTEKLVKEQQKKPEDGQSGGKDALCRRRDTAAPPSFDRHIDGDQYEVYEKQASISCKQIADHRERLSPVSIPAFSKRSRTMSSVFPATSGRRSATPSAVSPMKSSARMLFAILWSISR